MSNKINHLRTHRKHTDITQYDMAMLLEVKGNTIVSRCENGFRAPTVEMLVMYHLLFDTPMQMLISNHIEIFKEQLLRRIPVLIQEIEQTDMHKNGQSRIGFLKEAMTRLSATAA